MEPHYFEAHVTIKPVERPLLDTFLTIAKDHRFAVATFTKDSAGPDSMICTGRGKTAEELRARMLRVVTDLRTMGLTVTRYKLESTILDSRVNDAILPLKEGAEKRFAIRCTYQSPPNVSWMTDGDQDGDRWEGTKEEAEVHLDRLLQTKDHPERWTYVITEIK